MNFDLMVLNKYKKSIKFVRTCVYKMPQSKPLEHALKAIKEHPEIFEALEEYDRTREPIELILRRKRLEKIKD